MSGHKAYKVETVKVPKAWKKRAFIDKDERAGKGASDHAPVVVDLD